MSPSTEPQLTFALPKGRLLEQAMPLLEAAGVAPAEDLSRSRKLMIDSADPGVRLLVLRSADVPTFLEHGGADLGICGHDVAVEHGGQGYYQPVDLGIGVCRLALAGPIGQAGAARPPGTRLRIATKYPVSTQEFFARRGEQVEMIKLYGSMEIAPKTGLADLIVDLVETGSTLKANQLEEYETVVNVSARLLVNKASLKMNHTRVAALMQRFADAARARAPAEAA